MVRTFSKDKNRVLKILHGIGVILVAALLLELIAGVQIRYAHQMLENEAELHAENEMRMKAILIKGTLNSIQYALCDHARETKNYLQYPDSLYALAHCLLESHPNILGCGIAFVPYYYPQKGRLFEPWCVMRDGEPHFMQMADEENHDYTQIDFYTNTLATDTIYWSSPYFDKIGGLGLITTVAVPIHDDSGKTIGIMGADVSLDWLNDTINKRHIYPSSIDILLSKDGQMIAGPTDGSETMEKAKVVMELINDSTVKRRDSGTGATKIIKYSNGNHEKATIFHASMMGKPRWQIAVICHDNGCREKSYS